MKCLLVGCGNMGGALMARWAATVEADFTVLDPADLELPAGVSQVRSAADLSELYDVIILAVKPQMMATVCPSLVLYKAKGGLVVSIAAGTSIDTLKRLMGSGPTVRLMPNLPAKLGLGLSALASHEELSAENRAFTESLAAAVGRFMWVDGDDGIDRFTALAGSGPGYIFEMMRAFEATAIDQGFSMSDARMMVEDVFSGSAAFAKSSEGESFEDMRNAVTSKGGTTEAGLSVLRADDATEAQMKAAVAAAVARAKLLSQP